MRRISALWSFGWSVTPGQTQIFWSDFMSPCSLTLVLYLHEIFAVILIGSNFVLIGYKILRHWVQMPQFYMSRTIKNEYLTLVKQPGKS